ncbi:hypothetical protein TNCT_480151 [Trichonephila clavata]|uniref:Uncharacterized protein n=1 Tax=Trichonephila clavata TaxID=2740835 RepID=A0A8X6G9Y6_TRICU|nr:hypothetical protein TNCT_480151 [Trichonephila clavata]
MTTFREGGGGIMTLGAFSWYTLGLLIPLETCVNDSVHLHIVADNISPFMTMMLPCDHSYFQQDTALLYH